MWTIQELWEAEDWPIADGIYRANGEVLLFQHFRGLWLRPLVETTLEAIMKHGEEHMTSLTDLSANAVPKGGYRPCFGEGSDGSEGFVGVLGELSSEPPRLLWLAYFHDSNPFVKAEIVGAELVARSNTGETWTFQLDRPETIRVQRG